MGDALPFKLVRQLEPRASYDLRIACELCVSLLILCNVQLANLGDIGATGDDANRRHGEFLARTLKQGRGAVRIRGPRAVPQRLSPPAVPVHRLLGS